MTPQAAHKGNRSDIVLLSQQIVDYTRPQLFAVWKELNPDGYEPGSKKDLQKYFIERFGQHYRQHICIRCRLLSTAKHLRQPPIVKKKTSLPQPLGQLRTCHSGCHTAELYNEHLMIQTANGESAKSG